MTFSLPSLLVINHFGSFKHCLPPVCAAVLQPTHLFLRPPPPGDQSHHVHCCLTECCCSQSWWLPVPAFRCHDNVTIPSDVVAIGLTPGLSVGYLTHYISAFNTWLLMPWVMWKQRTNGNFRSHIFRHYLVRETYKTDHASLFYTFYFLKFNNIVSYMPCTRHKCILLQL